jgi:hypothetical protein
MNLADSTVCAKFVVMLERAERMSKQNARLTDWELTFVNDMRDRFDAREDQSDMGMQPWNPTTSQWNTLHEIQGKA